MENELKSIRYQSEKYAKLTTLMNRVNAEELIAAHEQQQTRKAAGVDGVTKAEYEEKLFANVRDLVQRMKAFKYIPQPVRRTYIPKLNGKMRPLGIPAYEDRLVQKVMADILIDIYEPRFLECSYGFRPNKNAHDVVRFINDAVMNRTVNFVLDADIKGFFDNLDQKWLMKFLEHDIADKNFLRYVARFLKAGIMEDAKIYESDKGAPQGGLISPILSNVYLYYVLDLWVERVAKQRCYGKAHYVRYADDFLVLFEYRTDAVKFLRWLKARLTKFGLELAEDKTRIVSFGRFFGTKDNFDFLGFTFYNTKGRNGVYRVGVKSSTKKLNAKRKALKAWLWTRLREPLEDTLRILNLKLAGHYQYYGVNGNLRELQKFRRYAFNSTYRMLKRRSQRSKLQIQKFQEIWDKQVAKPKITVQIW